MFELYEGRLGRFAAQLVRSRALAQDIVQQTFLDALEHQDELAEVENVEAWLFAIARNRALMLIRQQTRFSRALDSLRVVGPHASTPDFEAFAVRDLLIRALDPETRALVLLRYLHGFDAPELARMTGSTPAAIRQRLSRARARVRATSNDAIIKEGKS